MNTDTKTLPMNVRMLRVVDAMSNMKRINATLRVIGSLMEQADQDLDPDSVRSIGLLIVDQARGLCSALTDAHENAESVRLELSGDTP